MHGKGREKAMLTSGEIETFAGTDLRTLIGAEPKAVPGTVPVPFPFEHRWLAILITDIAGYSRLIEIDKMATAIRIRHLRQHVILPTVRAYHGWIVNHAGDGTLMAFGRCEDALHCAIALHRGLALAEQEVPADRRIHLHMGVSVGDVLIADGELYGNAPNIAARLQSLAKAGEVCVSDDVLHRIVTMPDAEVKPMGDLKLKNIARMVKGHRVLVTNVRPTASPVGMENRVRRLSLSLKRRDACRPAPP